MIIYAQYFAENGNLEHNYVFISLYRKYLGIIKNITTEKVEKALKKKKKSKLKK